MKNLALALVENFLFPKLLGEICSYPRKDYQMAYKLPTFFPFSIW